MTHTEKSIAYWCDGDTQNFHRTSLLAFRLDPTDGPSLGAVTAAYTRQQMGAETYDAVTKLIDPFDLYLYPALEQSTAATIDLINSRHCEHKTADVLADDGATMTLRCTWGCGRTRTVSA